MISPKYLLTLFSLGGISLAPAASVAVSSYSYLISPSSTYPDTGGSELTDGVTYSAAWAVPPSNIGYEDVVNLTGWSSNRPIIQFNFATVTDVGMVTIWIADSDGAAGVGIPQTITVRTLDSSFSQTFAITDPAGSGTTVPIILSGFSVNAASLVIDIEPNHQWTMLSEVQFNSIPEPSAFALVGIGLAGILRRRRVR